MRWRTAEDLAPAGQRINSPYDVEATFGNKRTTTWTGYKVHLAETCEPGEVHLITMSRPPRPMTADVDDDGPDP